MDDPGLYGALARRGMTRRSFLQFTSAMAAALALPAAYAPRIARAVEAAPRLPVVWIRGQACGGDTEALLRAADPSTAALLLEVLSVEYHESLLSDSGSAAELARTGALERYPNGYVAVIEGAVPSGQGGAFCLVGGRPVAEVVREVADGALATIALGSCAFDGGAPGAGANPTGAEGVRGLVGRGPFVALPGCPVNVVNLAATIVHYLTFTEWPPSDPMGRPLFAYGSLIHNQCERRPHFEFGEFALAWGDEGAQKGWCLYKLGCKGPEAMGNCPTVRWGEEISWSVRAGHGCVGCVMPSFWDGFGPAYRRLPSPVPFLPNLTADGVGTALVAGIGAVAATHAVGMTARFRRRARIAARAAAGAAGAAGAPPAAADPAAADPAAADPAAADPAAATSAGDAGRPSPEVR